jgi:NADP-dependent 3-hydroxy acid dehydrogenase YdfG
MWNLTPLQDKNIFVTGATSGIGRAIALACAQRGARLLVCGRRAEALHSLAIELRASGARAVWARPLDVRDRQAVLAWWAELPQEFQPVDILVNNAGLARGMANIRENHLDDWDEMIDTNLKGLLSVTQTVLGGMAARGRGHIVNLGSLAGVAAYPQGAVYCASKAAVKVFSDGLRQDLVDTAIRVTNIQPGMVETEFSQVRFHGDKDKAKAVYSGIEALSAEDIATTVLFALEAPEHVQICELTVTPTHQATGGVVYRRK